MAVSRLRRTNRFPTVFSSVMVSAVVEGEAKRPRHHARVGFRRD
jgi:hypothetical protein